MVNRRTQGYYDAAEQLANQLFAFVQQTRRERIAQRNRAENASEHFDWQNLGIYYDKAYRLAYQYSQEK